MMNSFLRVTAVAMLIAGAAGCASSGSTKQVTANINPNADFSTFQTYSFADAQGRMAGTSNSSTMAFAIASISRELLDRGLKPTNVSPDLKVDFYVGERTGVVTNNPRVTGRQAIQPFDGIVMWSGYDPGTAFSRPISEGVMMIVIYNTRTNALLFEGRAETRVSEAMRDDLGGTIDAVVAKILAELPDQ